MAKKRVTSRQVAERAGVSPTTVSFVLNEVKGAGISPATRKRVLAAARELGYVPSAAARTLVSGRTQTLGLVISHSEHLVVDAFIPQMLYGINQVARTHHYRVLVEAVEDVTRPDAYLELVRAKQIDGLIVLNPRRDDRQLPKLIDEGFPIVVVGDPGHHDGYAVAADDVGGAYRATKHLIALGHQRIGHLSFAPEVYLSSNRRLTGYRRALADADLEADPRWLAYGNYSAESGYHATLALFDAAPDLTALFAGNDTVALGALAALQQRGRRIPEDVAVVGYDDIPTAAYFTPPLTTIRSPAIEHGRRAAEILIALLDGAPPKVRQQQLDTPLIVRRSCGGVPTEPLDAASASNDG